ncbi:MAG: pyrimidine-nucleoside phosphorylase, partial [Ignavibacteria bacterium]
MNPTEIIRKKRDGAKLSRQELESFITSYLASGVADYQMSAFLMACYFRGMDIDETTSLTEVMVRSGAVADLSSVPGVKVDKHSTGGVGDKVSLILAPMVA